MRTDPKVTRGRGKGEMRLAVVLESNVESVDTAETLITEFCGDEYSEQQFGIKLAVREGMANAIKHGNRFDANKKVFFGAEMDATRLLISIRDQGSGCDVHSVPDPLDGANVLRDSGRGMFLMRTLMDDVTWQRTADGGTELIMTKLRSALPGEPK